MPSTSAAPGAVDPERCVMSCAAIASSIGDPEAVLVMMRRAFLNKGRHSAGVARQYRGTAAALKTVRWVFRGDASRLARPCWTANSTAQRMTNDPAAVSRRGSRRTSVRHTAAGPAHAAAGARGGVPGRWATGDSVYGMTGGCACVGSPALAYCWRSRAKQRLARLQPRQVNTLRRAAGDS